jgi:hypothetical protein
MGVPASEVGYTSATTGRGDHDVHKGHVVALKKYYIRYFPSVMLPVFKTHKPMLNNAPELLYRKYISTHVYATSFGWTFGGFFLNFRLTKYFIVPPPISRV